ncbi:hypothetical protein [Streptomyces sp. NPDC048641]|uniref:hypothetical protein n=1 Tax=Streptomyces sp. NPDC048641 TaxID=3154825 RepID=UPI00343E6126
MLIGELSDLRPRLDGEDVQSLPAIAVGPLPGQLAHVVEGYRTDSALRLLGSLHDNPAVAVLGLCTVEGAVTAVRIAVDLPARDWGWGVSC